ncbi:hypothetical protein [Burkholderia ubonensis]|uniref:nucleotide-binding protein n=1 Tax=Burkholderia ubonensis TaxID=101571 RepID=UPI0007553269|nr:hypothetical protein [Burkholderia ubonensis]KVR13147.1 hypothetical protein WK12_11795 [Burkholderia ubonensis]
MTETTLQNAIHFILQGKGGVGKSFVAVNTAQYWIAKDRTVVCADTDPVNATFTQYKSLNVAHIDILQGSNVLQQKFDPLMERAIETQADFVIDNGAATFLPLTNYMAENGIFELLANSGKKVFVHSILTGGQAKTDTLNGFEELAKRVDGFAKIVLWENEFWGPVDYDGYPITSLKVYKQHQSKVAGIVKLKQHTSDTFIRDTKIMTENHMTYDDVITSKDIPEFGMIAKNRMTKLRDEIFSAMNEVSW